MASHLRALAIASIVLAVLAPALTAQDTGGDIGLVSMALKVPVSVNLPNTASFRPVSTWRSFVALEEMRLELQFTNEAHIPLWIHRGELRSAIQFAVDAEAKLPVIARWLDEMMGPGSHLPYMVPSSETVLLEPQESAFWTVAVRRSNAQAFGLGTYRITMDVRNARRAVRDVDGRIWTGRGLHDGPFSAIIRVEPPTTTAEWGLRYMLEAEEKASRNEFTNALNAYRQAAAEVSPWETSGILGMAHMYRRLNRLSEAIPIYEKFFNASKRADKVFARLLALAYLADGQDAKAIDVLRDVGLPEAEVLTWVRELRERAKAERLEPER